MIIPYICIYALQFLKILLNTLQNPKRQQEINVVILLFIDEETKAQFRFHLITSNL